MKAINDRLFLVHADHAAPAATHDAVARVAALLLECCAERPTHSDLIVDAVMDALASVRPGWVRTKREWEAPRITTYVRANKVAAGGTDAANAITVLAHGFGAWGHDSATAAAAAAREKYEGVRRGVDAVRSRAENAERERDEARAEVERLRAELAAYTSASAVEATDAGPDAPALIVEGDAAKGAPSEGAVPAAPVSPAEQLDEETGADRPSTGDERIVGPREGQTVTSRANPPYGYEIDDSGDEMVLLTVQSEAAVMLRICELLNERRNATEIAATLNDEGHRSRTGTQWTPSSVRARILGSVDEWRGVSA